MKFCDLNFVKKMHRINTEWKCVKIIECGTIVIFLFFLIKVAKEKFLKISKNVYFYHQEKCQIGSSGLSQHHISV